MLIQWSAAHGRGSFRVTFRSWFYWLLGGCALCPVLTNRTSEIDRIGCINRESGRDNGIGRLKLRNDFRDRLSGSFGCRLGGRSGRGHGFSGDAESLRIGLIGQYCFNFQRFFRSVKISALFSGFDGIRMRRPREKTKSRANSSESELERPSPPRDYPFLHFNSPGGPSAQRDFRVVCDAFRIGWLCRQCGLSQILSFDHSPGICHTHGGTYLLHGLFGANACTA